MPTYLIYGIQVESNCPIPGMGPPHAMEGAADLLVSLGSLSQIELPGLGAGARPWSHRQELPDVSTEDPRILVDAAARRFRFEYSVGVTFVIDIDDSHVVGGWAEDATPAHASAMLVGPILGFYLRRIGVACLHASAISVDGRAIAFAAPSGTGKSTLAGHMLTAGHKVIADDVLALRQLDGQTLALPSHARLRLWPDAVEGLRLGDRGSERLIPDWDKRYVEVSERERADTPLPLAVVYLLERHGAATTAFLPVPPGEAVARLAAHTYRNELLDHGMRHDEFLVLADLALGVPVVRLLAAEGTESLRTLPQDVARDLATRVGSS